MTHHSVSGRGTLDDASFYLLRLRRFYLGACEKTVTCRIPGCLGTLKHGIGIGSGRVADQRGPDAGERGDRVVHEGLAYYYPMSAELPVRSSGKLENCTASTYRFFLGKSIMMLLLDEILTC